jgi:hypothetical protein
MVFHVLHFPVIALVEPLFKAAGLSIQLTGFGKSNERKTEAGSFGTDEVRMFFCDFNMAVILSVP